MSAMEQLKRREMAMAEEHAALPSSAVMMQQSLNKLTGQVEWNVVRLHDDLDDGEGRGGESGSSAEEVSEALTMTTYLDMLNDTTRNRAYHLAIQKAVKGGRHVLDIGAGTGLLSMMAWRSMCEEGKSKEDVGLITACESYLPMFKLACKLLRVNKVGAGVRLIHKRSDDMEVGIDMHSHADVLISEILDSELLGEGLIPSLRHAHENLLTPNARCVPYRATIYAQLVECEHLWKCHDLPGVESRLADGVVLAPSDYNQFQGRSAAMHVDPLASEMRLLSEPFEVFTFELSKAPAEFGQRQHSVVITNDGRAHALVSWWVLQLDAEGEIFYSTAPKWIKNASANGKAEIDSQTEWREHWKQVVWFLPRKGLLVSSGEEVIATASHDVVSVRYDVMNSRGSGMPKDGIPEHNIDCLGLFEASMTPDRIGVLGHDPWREGVRLAAETALRCRKSLLCVVLDDSLLMTIMSASVNAAVEMIAMFPGRAVCQAYVDDLRRTMGQNAGGIKVLNKKATSLTTEDLGGRKIDVLMAEPYYTSCSRMLPWRSLRFWYERTQLTSLLSENARLIPCRASLRGVAVNMPDLWKSRRFIKSVEGFDHSPINSVFGACGELPLPDEVPILSYAVWQCGQYEELTDVFTVMEFDFSHPIRTMEGVTEVAVRRTGLCHGIVLWMDWSLDPDGALLLSTGPAGGKPNYWKQGVKLLRSPIEIGVAGASQNSHISPSASPTEESANSLVKVAGLFDSCNGDLKVTSIAYSLAGTRRDLPMEGALEYVIWQLTNPLLYGDGVIDDDLETGVLPYLTSLRACASNTIIMDGPLQPSPAASTALVHANGVANHSNTVTRYGGKDELSHETKTSRAIAGMEGGAGEFSYTRNSRMQSQSVNIIKPFLQQAISELNLDDWQAGSPVPMAAFGCAVGANTLQYAEISFQSVQECYRVRTSEAKEPPFVQYFCDLPSNDFNTLFRQLED